MRHLITLLALVATSAQADSVAQAVGIPGWRTDSGHMAGLKLELAPGWKTYWRAPGDGGLPPQFDFSESENVESVKIHWPAPKVQDIGGFRVIVYPDGVTWPLEVTLTDPSRPARLNASVDLGVCEEICVPAEVSFAVDLPIDGKRNAAILGALLDVPTISGQVDCAMTSNDDGLELKVSAPTQRVAHAVVETGNPSHWVSEPDLHNDGALTAEVDVVPYGGPLVIDRSGVRLTVFAPDGSVTAYQGCE